MFVKIVRHMDGERGVTSNKGTLNVVPKEQTLYEISNDDENDIPRVQYSKHAATSLEEFYETVERIAESDSYEIVGYVCNDKGQLLSEEFLILQMIPKNRSCIRTIVATKCWLYILNNDGKTIDSLWCN